MDKLKIGILGASRGMDYANRILIDYEYADIFAICENYEPLLNKAKESLSGKGKNVLCFCDYDEFLDCGIDAVIICNYANSHAEYAVRALNRGVHVLSEVLPCETLAQAVQLCEAVEKSGCVYAYSENYCYFDSTFEMMRIYETGVIGEAVCIEGDFINDCSHKWHLLTRGIRNHWRNYVPSTFYCTHSIGPMLYSTGMRGVRVNGFEIPRMDYMAELGARSGSAAMEVLELLNGGIAKSMNGNYRDHYTARYRIIGSRGTIEANASYMIRVHIDTGSYNYTDKTYNAVPYDFKYRPKGEYGLIENADLLSVGFFIGKIFGDSESEKRSIDIYRALDMSVPGLLAYRSILEHGAPYDIPDLRSPSERDKFRNDIYSTNPDTPDEYRLPTSKTGTPDVDDSTYTAVAEKFNTVDLTPGGK